MFFSQNESDEKDHHFAYLQYLRNIKDKRSRIQNDIMFKISDSIMNIL